MTSMLLTVSATAADGAGCAVIEIPGRRRLHFLAAVAGCDLLLDGVLVRALLDHLVDQRAVARHERCQGLEFLPVPLLELDHARALVIGATRLDWREQPGGTELLQTRFAQVEMLETPAHLLGRHDLALAEVVLRLADRLDDHDRVRDASRVIDRADAPLVLEVALARTIDL